MSVFGPFIPTPKKNKHILIFPKSPLKIFKIFEYLNFEKTSLLKSKISKFPKFSKKIEKK
jgi:hypothetical protein